jgi:hypothetical protein
MHPGGRVVVVPDCGHWGLLAHERVVRSQALPTSPDLAFTHGDVEPRASNRRPDSIDSGPGRRLRGSPVDVMASPIGIGVIGAGKHERAT